jgi:diguanylate cyclase (GGDEF)-like protein/PAS domain S-box-containing protein
MKLSWPKALTWLLVDAGVSTALAALLVLVNGPYPAIFLLAVPLMLSAYRYERRIYGISLAMMAVSAGTVILFTETSLVGPVLVAVGACLVFGAASEGIYRLSAALRWTQTDLASSEGQFRHFLANSKDGFGLADAQGVVQLWNAEMEQLTGVTGAQAVGKRIWEIFTRLVRSGEDLLSNQDTFKKEFGIAVAKKTSLLLDKPMEGMLAPTGMPNRNVQVRFFSVDTGRGFSVGVSVRDFTLQKQTELELKTALAEIDQRDTNVGQVLQGTRSLLSEMDLLALQEQVVHMTQETLGYSSVALMWINRETHSVELPWVLGYPDDIQTSMKSYSCPVERISEVAQIRYHMGHGYFIPAEAWNWEHELLGLPETDHIRSEPTDATKWQPGDGLFLPLGAESGAVLGYLCLGLPVDGLRPQPESMALVEIFCNLAGQCLESASLFGKWTDETQLRKTVESMLRQSQADLANAERVTHLGLWRQDLIHQGVVYSEELRNILGSSSGKNGLGAIQLAESIHPDDRAAYTAFIDQLAKRRETMTLETRVIRADGSVRFVNHVAKAEYNDAGECIRLTGTLQDISPLKRTQQALRQSEDLLRGVISNMADGIALIDYQGNLQEWNPSCEQITGLKRDHILGKASWGVMYDLVPENQKTPADFEQLRDWTLELLRSERNKQIPELEFTIERADGDQRAVQYHIFQIPTARGNIGCGLLKDITALRKVELALHASEEILRAFFSQLTNSVVLVNSKGAVIEWNQASEQMTGLARSEVIGQPYWDVQYRIIGDEFKTPAFYNYLKIETTKALQTGDSALLSNPLGSILQPVNGEKRNIEQVLFTIRTSQGFMLGSIFWDITALVQGEAGYKESQEKFSRIFDDSPIGIAVYNAQGELVSANPACLKMFGARSSEDLRLLKLFDEPNLPGDYRARLFKGESVSIATEFDFDSSQSRNVLITTRKGKISLSIVIAPFTSSSESRGFLVQMVDLTHLKKAEQSIRDQQQLMEALRDTTSALNSTLQLDEVMDRIIENVRRVVAHDGMTIMMVEDGIARVIRSSGYAERRAVDYIRTVSFVVSDVPNLRRMFETGQPMVIPDTQAFVGWVDFPATKWIRSYLGVPIIQKGRLVGYLNLDSQDANFFTEADAQNLLSFASQAGIAIENARLYSDLQNQASEISTLYRASAQMLISGGDLENLSEQIAETLTHEFSFVDCGVFMLDSSRTYLKRLVRKGKFKVKGNMPMPMDGPGLTVRAANTKTLAYAPDVHHDKDYIGGNPDTRSELAVPLLARGQVIGVLDLQSPNLDAFDERARRLVSAFAEQAGLALENARLYEDVQEMAIHDELTGVFNRRGLHEFGQREVERATRYNRPLSALFLDIDHFKQFNDVHSYFVGDQVLRAIAGCLRFSVREVDLASRYGGEEFVVLLPETDLDVACQVAERLREEIEHTQVQTNKGNLAVTVSIGVARLQQVSSTKKDTDALAGIEHHGLETLNVLLDQAGKALHTAKNEGRNRVVCASS